MVNNPAAALRIPRTCQPGRTMRPLTEEEVLEFLEVFDLREELISRLAIYEGMRPGEILALRWKAVRHCALWVEQRVYKRVFDTPKNGKSREVGLSDGTSALLKEWRDLAEDAGPEGFVARARRSLRRCRRTTFGDESCSQSWRRPAWVGHRSRFYERQMQAYPRNTASIRR